MVPGGATEIISYFAGYLRLADDIAKDRLVYQDGVLKLPQEDYTATLPDHLGQSDFAPFDTYGQQLPEGTQFEAVTWPATYAIALRSLASPSSRPADFSLPEFKGPPPSGGSSGGSNVSSGGGPLTVTIDYQIGGEQWLAEISQTNMMVDDDQLLEAEDTGVTELHQINIAETVQDMVEAAHQAVPDNLVAPQQGTGQMAEFLAAHDAEIAAGGGAPDEHSVAPGRYVNGELQAEPEPQEPPAEASPVDLGTDPGQWAEIGLNTALNAGLIVDLTESGRTMIVMGDYFKTNAIIQTNSFIDNDQVAVAGGDGTGQVLTGGNTADNIANFIQEAGPYAAVTARFAETQWNVDVVNGNFYDITLLLQQNYLSDNDVTVQDSQSAHYEVKAGANGLYNITEIFGEGFKYDLIIVAGTYHGANLIYQHNIILDDDIVKIAADGADPSQSVVAGQNDLLNNATIASYGDNLFLPVGSDMQSIVAALANHDGMLTLDPSFGNLIPGLGTGELNILYITGDYYDINALWQINVIADVDTAIQLLGVPDPQVGEASEQSATSGGNKLTNDAAIVDVGATETYVQGDVYTDTILIQGKLVDDDDDEVVYGDTETLVSELIAFTDSSESQSDELVPTQTSVVHDDAIGSILH